MLAGLVSGRPSCALLYPAALTRALLTLADPALRNAPVGRYALQDEQMYYLLRDYDSQPVEQLFPESHRDYCDVQVVISGKEVIGWAPRSSSLIEKDAYSADNDIQFYKQTPDLTFFVANPGRFFLFTPDDLHMPGVAINGAEIVRKAVVKIHRDLLS